VPFSPAPDIPDLSLCRLLERYSKQEKARPCCGMPELPVRCQISVPFVAENQRNPSALTRGDMFFPPQVAYLLQGRDCKVATESDGR
jgi:hypothetical protein